jgi:putative aldouronate transport system substrate-binding protein
MKEQKNALKRIFCLSLLGLVLAGGVYAGGRSQSTGGGTQVKELKALVPNNSGNDMNDNTKNPVTGWLNEATGVKVTYDPLPGDQPLNKLNAIMAAGALDYDFVIMAGGYKDRYAEYAIQGALFDIGAVFNNYPNLKATPQELIDMVKVGNTFYTIPSLSPSGRDESANADSFLLWRTDILATMGRKMPTTLDEFTSVLQAFKDQDPMKSGSANAPLSVSIDNLNDLRTSSIGGAFGVELDWIEQGGTLVPYQTQQGFFEFIQYLHDLYVKGLMDKEMPTNNGSAVREKFTTNKALVRTDGWWDIPALIVTFKSAYPAATMEFSQPLERGGKAGARAAAKNPIDLFCVIPRNAKNWQATMAYLDKKMDPNIFKEMVIGKEGTDYTVDAKGEIWPILPTFFDHRGNANWYLTGTPPEYNKYWWEGRAKKDDDQLKVYKQVNLDYGRLIHVDISSAAPCTVFSQIATASGLSSNMAKEFTVNSIVNGITRAQFDTFVADWKAQCGDGLSKAYNDWYKSR